MPVTYLFGTAALVPGMNGHVTNGLEPWFQTAFNIKVIGNTVKNLVSDKTPR